MTESTKDQFSREQIDAMRAKLAKMWGQRIDQVNETEARYYLRAGWSTK